MRKKRKIGHSAPRRRQDARLPGGIGGKDPNHPKQISEIKPNFLCDNSEKIFAIGLEVK